MLFFNGRIRNTHITPGIMREDPYSHTIGQSCIITTCLTLIIGLTLIVNGVISETKKTALIGIGVISIGVSIFLTTILCFDTQLRVCYRNWAYGPPIAPIRMECSQGIMAATMSISTMREATQLDNEATYNSILTTDTYVHSKSFQSSADVDQQREILSNLNLRSLPSVYQQAFLEARAVSEDRADEVTWCCKNGNPAKMKVITTTYIRWEPTGQTQAVHAGYESCGFGGWSKCSTYGIQHVPTSHLAYGHELVPDVENSQCPENHLVCCKSMIPVAGFCMSIPEFNRVVAEWAKLQATHPDTTLANLIVSIQNNGLSSLSG
ncbi:unnamed protein product [Adineta ricciae]|uniref:Uncharacterized protein n=1 Tax=Adineta ricciae TaxID=249248 RepID=A0A814CCZ6_ADIRI|nr:unnamed protein product [Adineta ricciae]